MTDLHKKRGIKPTLKEMMVEARKRAKTRDKSRYRGSCSEQMQTKQSREAAVTHEYCKLIKEHE